MTAEGCPKCGDQTLWRISRTIFGRLEGFCRLCRHTWPVEEANVYRCDDPEGDWIDEQKREAAEARAEHWAEARAVEDHQERKHRHD